MLLVDLNEEEAEQFSDELSELGFEYNVDHDIWMMPVVKNIQSFIKWSVAFKRHKDTLAYFNKNYVVSEIFPRKMGRQIVKAKNLLDYAKRYITKRKETEEL